MEITVSTPGSPGTSFTENVKDKIITIFDVLESSSDFPSVRALGTELEKHGINWNYARNILPFLQNCGLVDYQDVASIDNKRFFTNIGYAYVDILKAIRTLKSEPQSESRDEILAKLEKIQETIYFQSLVIMMKNKKCNYAHDFFDVMCFVKQYGSIDSTEYLLIQYEREQRAEDLLSRIAPIVQKYRDGEMEISVKTNTRHDESGEAKSVNSFPYVNGNFMKSGVFYKGEDGRYYLSEDRIDEINSAIKEF